LHLAAYTRVCKIQSVILSEGFNPLKASYVSGPVANYTVAEQANQQKEYISCAKLLTVLLHAATGKRVMKKGFTTPITRTFFIRLYSYV
jgi:hypothetical protein